MSNYYWELKRLLSYYSQASFVMKDKIFDMFRESIQEVQEESENPTEK